MEKKWQTTRKKFYSNHEDFVQDFFEVHIWWIDVFVLKVGPDLCCGILCYIVVYCKLIWPNLLFESSYNLFQFFPRYLCLKKFLNAFIGAKWNFFFLSNTIPSEDKIGRIFNFYVYSHFFKVLFCFFFIFYILYFFFFGF